MDPAHAPGTAVTSVLVSDAPRRTISRPQVLCQPGRVDFVPPGRVVRVARHSYCPRSSFCFAIGIPVALTGSDRGNGAFWQMSAAGRLLKTGLFCGRCGPTDRDPIVSHRCKRCGAPIRAPLRSRIRSYRKEEYFFAMFALEIAGILVFVDFV